MKNIYLLLSIIGYAATFPLMLLESYENKNWLLWTKPDETALGLFANRISIIFALDLLPAVLVFLIWCTVECQRLGMKRVWLYWVLTLLFGLGGTFPLFLWAREKAVGNRQ